MLSLCKEAHCNTWWFQYQRCTIHEVTIQWTCVVIYFGELGKAETSNHRTMDNDPCLCIHEQLDGANTSMQLTHTKVQKSKGIQHPWPVDTLSIHVCMHSVNVLYRSSPNTFFSIFVSVNAAFIHDTFHAYSACNYSQSLGILAELCYGWVLMCSSTLTLAAKETGSWQIFWLRNTFTPGMVEMYVPDQCDKRVSY